MSKNRFAYSAYPAASSNAARSVYSCAQNRAKLDRFKKQYHMFRAVRCEKKTWLRKKFGAFHLHNTGSVVELLDPQNPANSPPPDFVSYWRDSHETAPDFDSVDGFNGCNVRLLRHWRRLLWPTRMCPGLRWLQRVRTCTVRRRRMWMQRRWPCDDGRASHFFACSRDAGPGLQRSVLASLSASSIASALPRCVRSIAALAEW